MARWFGRPFMGWQQYVADVALEVNADGRFVYQVVDVAVPRQSGKTTLFGLVMEHRALTVMAARVWFTAQAAKDANDWLLNEHVPMLEAAGGEINVRRAQGSEHVRWRRSGGMVRPFAPQPKSLHGKTSDLVVVDEAWSFDQVRGVALDQAIVPTQATKPGAQVWKVSTAGDDHSKWWHASVELGRAAVAAGRQSGRCYFEWSCPDDLDPTDEETWPGFHPAFGRTIGRDAMLSALDQLGPEEFARAYGNRWLHTVARAIPAESWVAAADHDQPIPTAGTLALGFDVAVDRSDASIVAAWRDHTGVVRWEVADNRPAAGWVAGRLLELVDRWRPTAVGYDAAGPALDVADEAARAGVVLSPVKGRDYQAACAAALDALTDTPPRLRYRPHGALAAAAGAAGARTVGDGWVWARRGTDVSLSPLTAATVAGWVYDHAPASLGAFRIY
jgi:phage terminase large subunit-like protein